MGKLDLITLGDDLPTLFTSSFRILPVVVALHFFGVKRDFLMFKRQKLFI
jgi:hypothetical protein